MDYAYYKNLKIKILISNTLIPFIPFILVIIISFYYFATSLQNNTILKMTRIVEDHRQMIQFFLNERKADLEYITNSHDYEFLRRSSNLENILKNLQQKSNAFVDLGIFNQSGIHTAYCGPHSLTGKNYSNASWYKEVMRNGYYLSDVFLGYRRIPHFVIALAHNDRGRTWIIRATIDTVMFSDMVEKIQIGKTGEAFILNSNGILQTKKRSGGDLMDKLPGSIQYIKKHPGIMTFFNESAKGETHLYATAWLQNNSWLLVVRQKESDAFKALHSAIFLVVLISIIGGIIIVMTAFYMANRIIHQIKRTNDDKGKLNQQLIFASRLAEIGEMSAGFAHEINNPLQIIKAEQTLIDTILYDIFESGRLKDSEDVQDLLDSINQIKVQVDRCAEITRSILEFARPKDSVTQKIELKKFLPEITNLIIRKAKVEGITIKLEISNHLPALEADPSLLQQVLVNLLNNAIDSIVEAHGSQGGELTVNADMKNHRFEISVADNGCGINPDNREKIFIPFFTTKRVGKGTGLGLSICYSIIKNMGGVMSFGSVKNIGTIFTIHLPVNP